MAGIEHDALSDIQTIRRLLDVYQPGFAFLKELIQNADDAEATSLRLCWHPGLSKADHPLLKGPALVSINDGGFTPEDKHSLLRMGLGNKGGNSGKIGKFGLGTKSIFHVAEAFFFLESSENLGLRDILNPWSPRFHKEWDTVSDPDWDLLSHACSKIGEGLNSWFAMWIPLRSERQLKGIDAIRSGTGAFPGDFSTCPEELVVPFLNTNPKLGLVLPMLNSLREVNFEDSADTVHRILIDRESGEITQDNSTSSYQIAPSSVSEKAEEWQALPAWPKVFRLEEDASESALPDKAEWSHAAILTTTPTGRSKACFRIYWSVFLPVGNEPYLEVELPSAPRDISLFLHGYFFLNDSRTEIRGLSKHFPKGDKDDSVGICLAWNRALACEEDGLLPSLLPQLGDWLETGAISQNEVSSMATAIRDSPLWQNLRAPLTSKGSLVYALRNGSWKWHWIPKEQATTVIPAITDRESLEVLRSLELASGDDSGTVFAISCPGYHGLAGDLFEFNDDCLLKLRRLIGDQDLNDRQASLISLILRTAQDGASLPHEWRDVPLYRIHSKRNGWQRVTAADLSAKHEAGNLFAHDEHELAPLLSTAVGELSVPFLTDKHLPPGCNPPNLTFERAAGWIVSQSALSPDPKNRLKLFKRIAKREQFSQLELSALRYLAHGNHAHQEEDDAGLFYKSAEKMGQWNEAFGTVLKSSNLSWTLIDARFGRALTDPLKQRLKINSCSREAWPDLVESIGERAGEVDFSSVSKEAIECVILETTENRLACLKPLKLHRFSATEMVAASDAEVWLDTGLDVPGKLSGEWRHLRESARILIASQVPAIAGREKQLFGERILDASGALRRCAKSDHPERHQLLILHLLALGTPTKEAIQDLKGSPWLSLKDGSTVEPKTILHLDNLEQIISNTLALIAPCPERSSAEIPDEIRECKGWKTLATQILPTPREVIERLSDRLQSPPNSLSIGYSVESPEALENWLSVVSNSRNLELYPARPLLKSLADREDWKEHALTLAKQLGKSLRGEGAHTIYLNRILDLQEIHKTCENELKGTVTREVAHSLAGAVEGGVWDQLKEAPNLLLLSGDGKWRAPTKIAAPCAGVRPSALLHNELADALQIASTIPAAPPEDDVAKQQATPTISEEQSARDLRSLLRPFHTRLQEKAVAILPAMLGTDGATKAFAQELLGGVDPELIKEELIPSDHTVDDPHGGRLRDRSAEWVFRVEMIRGESVTLKSIQGDEFQAPLAGSSKTVFLPNPNGQLLRWAGGNLQILCVAEPSRFESLSDRELRDVIVESISDLMWWAYAFRPPNLGAVFEKYEGLGQLSLGVARQEILRSADTHLQMLGVAPAGLEQARDLASEARTRLSEADSGLGDEIRLRKEGEELEKKARQLFLEQLDHNTEVHDDLLSGIRKRIARQQYEIDSIPFEILQNADDAATELLQHADIPEEDLTSVSKFVIQPEDERLSFYYGGRPINSSCNLTGPAANRFKRDLVKMLLLNGSDKNTIADEQEATGMFGLGFKSVFLLTDVPRVKSGKLHFEIHGGIWPKEAGPEQFEAASNAFGSYSEKTSITLPAKPDLIQKCLSRFISLAPWTVVFTKNIETIIAPHEGQHGPLTWRPRQVRHHPNLRFGKIQTSEGESSHIELRSGSIQWLIQIENGRITKLPTDVPWLWVTTPTREPSHGFIINAPFALDPGRTRLSKQQDDVKSTNSPLFRSAADLFQEQFGGLAVSPKALEEIEAPNSYAFWESLWQLMSSLPRPTEEPAGIDFLANALWQTEQSSGYAGLIQQHAVLPNALHGKLKTLTTTRALHYRIEGWLAGPEGCNLVLDAIQEQLTPFEDPSECCSHKLASELHKRLPSELESYGLVDLLGEAVDQAIHITPKRASLVGAALNPEKVDSQDLELHAILDLAEASRFESLEKTAKFQSEGGSWRKASDLVLSDEHDAAGDEPRRAAFAPEDRVLASSYGRAGAQVLIAIRKSMQADAEELASWIKSMGPNGVTDEALHYLATGDLRDQLALKLGISWLQSVKDSSTYQALEAEMTQAIDLAFEVATSMNKRNLLQGKISWDESDEDDPESNIEESSETLTPEEILRVWNEPEAVKLFTLSGPLRELILPGAEDDAGIRDVLSDEASLPGKIAWYRLLCLGCTLGIPWGRQPFHEVKRLWEGNLGARFWPESIPESLRGEDLEAVQPRLDLFFREIIDRYYKNENASGEDAEFWRRVFYDFRKMHHFVFRNHLPETILEFARYDEADGSNLIRFLRSGHIPPKMQDPNHPRFRGVIGQSMKAPLLFVMRELSRLGVLDHRFASASFYLNSPVRRVACQLGWLDAETGFSGDFTSLVDQSENIHSHIQNELPELDGFYDLPLQLYAQKES